jgi:hypothetical protein
MRKPKKQKKPLNDLSRSLTPFDPNQTLITVVDFGPPHTLPWCSEPSMPSLSVAARWGKRASRITGRTVIGAASGQIRAKSEDRLAQCRKAGCLTG